jgi:hypothetical protein
MEFLGNGQLPVGFGMSLAMDVKAMTNFSSLPDTKKEQLVSYITSSTTGYEAKDRIVEVVNQLHNDSFH